MSNMQNFNSLSRNVYINSSNCTNLERPTSPVANVLLIYRLHAIKLKCPPHVSDLTSRFLAMWLEGSRELN